MGGFVAQVGFDRVVCLASPPQVRCGMERFERQPHQKVAGVEHAGDGAQAPPGAGAEGGVGVGELGNCVPREAEGGGSSVELGAREGRVQAGQRVEDGRPRREFRGGVVDAGGRGVDGRGGRQGGQLGAAVLVGGVVVALCGG